MVPMRFIAVGTERGHAMDVPWDRWAHSEPESDDQRKCRSQDLLFKPRAAATEGLASLEVVCVVCRAGRHFGDLTTRNALSRIGVRCTRHPNRGKRPGRAAATNALRYSSAVQQV